MYPEAETWQQVRPSWERQGTAVRSDYTQSSERLTGLTAGCGALFLFVRRTRDCVFVVLRILCCGQNSYGEHSYISRSYPNIPKEQMWMSWHGVAGKAWALKTQNPRVESQLSPFLAVSAWVNSTQCQVIVGNQSRLPAFFLGNYPTSFLDIPRCCCEVSAALAPFVTTWGPCH